ncbi:hypothetical protein SAMN05428989_0250 [Pseudoxanthomonas sp. GM95]|uniref:hypothetical protein n=1 Tax=Pseudoxanthomonas sp. GM95 TaxID=1881043 RepID=UPI0008B4CCF3|nr:hypothetical protein [Pseudoxanthomonas sp. GM95]SEK51039.1 hypothetical protein SAMN05428989_0250 [Pseudoxanthomonas sp. GM95]
MDGTPHPMLARVPELPIEAIRHAIHVEDWEQAEDLLSHHQHQLVLALAKVDLKTADRGPWLDLLSEHRGLMDELREGRDAASAELARLGAGRRGANAWLRALK